MGTMESIQVMRQTVGQDPAGVRAAGYALGKPLDPVRGSIFFQGQTTRGPTVLSLRSDLGLIAKKKKVP